MRSLTTALPAFAALTGQNNTVTVASEKTEKKEWQAARTGAPAALGRANSDSAYSLGYIPALDGLRALSIILVMAFHDIGPVSSQFGHAFNGWVGVDVFFVISGFLISSILLKEAAEHRGEIKLTKFYTRRWLRIAPVYYAFLAVVLGWHVWGGDHHFKPYLAAALYLTNLDLAFSWNLIPLKLGISHLWSLGLEEQFYLFWPFCLKLLKKHALKFVLASIALVYTWRLYLISQGADWLRLVHGFDTKIDTIMIGVLCAILLRKASFKEKISKFLGNTYAQLTLACLMLYSFKELGHPMAGGINEHYFFWGLKMPVCNLLIASVLLSVLANPRALVSVILANPIAVFIGKLSYSLYLWHPLVHSIYCGFYWDYFCKHGPSAEFYQYILIFLSAIMSYYLIEKPFLKLKTRFAA